jgi:hypothetical protein
MADSIGQVKNKEQATEAAMTMIYYYNYDVGVTKK